MCGWLWRLVGRRQSLPRKHNITGSRCLSLQVLADLFCRGQVHASHMPCLIGHQLASRRDPKRGRNISETSTSATTISPARHHPDVFQRNGSRSNVARTLRRCRPQEVLNPSSPTRTLLLSYRILSFPPDLNATTTCRRRRLRLGLMDRHSHRGLLPPSIILLLFFFSIDDLPNHSMIPTLAPPKTQPPLRLLLQLGIPHRIPLLLRPLLLRRLLDTLPDRHSAPYQQHRRHSSFAS